MRFKCRKRDIKKEVEKHIREVDYLEEELRDLEITIDDCYITTEHEV